MLGQLLSGHIGGPSEPHRWAPGRPLGDKRQLPPHSLRLMGPRERRPDRSSAPGDPGELRRIMGNFLHPQQGKDHRPGQPPQELLGHRTKLRVWQARCGSGTAGALGG